MLGVGTHGEMYRPDIAVVAGYLFEVQFADRRYDTEIVVYREVLPVVATDY